jgi:hypothetical protein
MSKSLPEHLVDFLAANPGPQFLTYRRRCLEYWEKHYGASVVTEVKKLAEKRWKQSQPVVVAPDKV